MATMYGFFPMTSSPSPDDSDHSVSTACSLSATQPERRNTMQPCRRSFPDVGPARVCPPCCVRPTTCFLSALEGSAHVVDYEPRSFTLGSVSSVLLGLLPCARFSAPHLPGRRPQTVRDCRNPDKTINLNFFLVTLSSLPHPSFPYLPPPSQVRGGRQKPLPQVTLKIQGTRLSTAEFLLVVRNVLRTLDCSSTQEDE